MKREIGKDFNLIIIEAQHMKSLGDQVKHHKEHKTRLIG